MKPAPGFAAFSKVMWLALGLTAWTRHAWAEPESPARASPASKRELTVIPTAGGTSDIGFGGGYVLSLASVDPRVEPYWWRLESAGLLTLRKDEPGKLDAAYIDNYVLVDFPNVIERRLGLKARVSFTREQALKFYGLGNSATATPSQPHELDYSRTHPTLRFEGEWRFSGAGRLYWGASYTYNWLSVDQESLLGRTMREGSAHERRLLGDAGGPHGVATFMQGFGWDQRDDVTSPQRGQFHDARIELSPGNDSPLFRYRFARVSGTARFYLPIVPDRLGFAARLVGDALFGDAPFYELSRYQDTYAIGGSKGVRGVPAQRYYGKLKLFANLELRSQLFEFRAFSKSNKLGLAAFFDTGRLWADYHDSSSLDGAALGLKYGVGGGVRWAAGKSFVLRLDVAWSPDADPVGAYLAGGHMF